VQPVLADQPSFLAEALAGRRGGRSRRPRTRSRHSRRGRRGRRRRRRTCGRRRCCCGPGSRRPRPPQPASARSPPHPPSRSPGSPGAMRRGARADMLALLISRWGQAGIPPSAQGVPYRPTSHRDGCHCSCLSPSPPPPPSASGRFHGNAGQSDRGVGRGGGGCWSASCGQGWRDSPPARLVGRAGARRACWCRRRGRGVERRQGGRGACGRALDGGLGCGRRAGACRGWSSASTPRCATYRPAPRPHARAEARKRTQRARTRDEPAPPSRPSAPAPARAMCRGPGRADGPSPSTLVREPATLGPPPRDLRQGGGRGEGSPPSGVSDVQWI
jgi:hypothetical protein